MDTFVDQLVSNNWSIVLRPFFVSGKVVYGKYEAKNVSEIVRVVDMYFLRKTQESLIGSKQPIVTESSIHLDNIGSFRQLVLD